jgi:hypothetical protein
MMTLKNLVIRIVILLERGIILLKETYFKEFRQKWNYGTAKNTMKIPLQIRTVYLWGAKEER